MKPEQVKERIEQTFPGSVVVVRDLTGTQDHYEVEVTSALFKDQSRIDRQRSVMDALSEELKTGEVHALTIRTHTP
jgi:stress-induced morphogen